MSKKKRFKVNNQKLGRGLSSLLGEQRMNSVSAEKAGVDLIDIELITKGGLQPRKNFSNEELEELSNSIKQHGLLQPIILRKSPNTKMYEVVAGERRYKASKIAGLKKIPAIVKDVEDIEALALAIVENVQREDLSPIEEATGYKRLIDEFRYTQDHISSSVGKSRSHITNLLRLLSLPEEVQSMVSDGLISMGHARTLVNNKNAIEIAKEIMEQSLNVRETEQLAKNHKLKKLTNEKDEPISDEETISLRKLYVSEAENTLKTKHGWNVKIGYNVSKDEGKIIINYKGIEELDKVLKKIL